ncbi:DNA polymerase III subunit alpha [Mycoplasmopsis alligatoris]|uniref:DNA-directed DNA polymerase n=1 Tax=Mycoplasmopsis alligatoris A21JP2 TaxID=747682 RepID=D4XW46_9BACT|nr:DNA polymerase III subunit alpha [Mycoplasmopsis alligatoris]EFF41404.1 putative DNA polymerase III DnaE [Mycoplasmopsis alligatoris A21JP2]
MKTYYLHTNTEYSFLNSTIKLTELFELAKQKNISALSMTDINNMFALGEFLNLSKQYQIKPLIGIEIEQKNVSFMVFAKNYDGYVLLNKIAFEVSKNIELNIDLFNSNNLIIIDHLTNGFVAKGIEIPFKNNFWFNSKKLLNDQTIYAPVKKVLLKNQNQALKALQSTGNNKVYDFEYEDYFNDNDFKDVNILVLQNIKKLVESIDIKIPDNSLKLAQFKTDIENDQYLYMLCLNSLKKLENEFASFDKTFVLERLNFEFETIKKLGFVNYFLIINDVLSYARKNGIYVGPGRGSAAGSLISFLLEITQINPLKYNLLFERFLNIQRVSLPDIDIDIQDDRRDEIAQYIVEKYGYQNTAFISTFQSIGAKMAIRDIGRYLNIPLKKVDSISKSIDLNEDLKTASKSNRSFKAEIEELPELLELALQIEGLPRQQGMHPAGIIICDREITNIAPTHANTANMAQVQLTLNNLEKYGLLKIDFLGLKTLSIIRDIESVIPEEYKFDFLLKNNPSILNNNDTFRILNEGLTEGIFQLESPGMKSAIKKVEIDSFNDLVAIISLFRPGPMQFINDYAKGKKDSKLIEKIHPLYDEIVKETFGVIVYQEQIMQIVQKVSNMSFSQADLLRRAISKKDENLIHSGKKEFIQNGLKNNIELNVLEKIYKRIEMFADYGFNKSHAVAYAYLTYKMAYYKTNYKNVFYRALITSANGTHLTINKYVKETKKINLPVASPDINRSKNYVVVSGGILFLPINMIKGVGGAALSKILEQRDKNGVFNSFFETYLRLRLAGVGEAILLLLIKSNTLRIFGNCAALLNSLSLAKNYFETFKLKMTRQKIDETNYDQELLEFIKSNDLSDQKLILSDREIDLEADYELELLGNKYNAFLTSEYENEIKLFNFPAEIERKIAVVIDKFICMPQNNYCTLYLSDSSDQVSLFISKSEQGNYIDAPKNRPIKVKLYRSLKNKFYIKEWEAI